MGTPLPDQHPQNVQGMIASSQQPPVTRPKRLSLLWQWGLVGCLALALFLLIRSRPQDPSNFAPVDQIACSQGEQLAFHIHAHLSIMIDGQTVPLPGTIGIAPSSCLYWLHTHLSDGIIHMEAPHLQSFILGNFLDLWKQRFSRLAYPKALDQIAGWQAYLNGKPFTGNYRTIPLQAHLLITLAYHSPNVHPDTVYNWGDL